MLSVTAAAQSPTTNSRNFSGPTFFEQLSSVNLSRPSFEEYMSVVVLLSATDTVHEAVYVRRNFTDQFLELRDKKAFLPASRIYGFVQDSTLYRGVRVDRNTWVFAEQLISGNMSLYYAENAYAFGEQIEFISSDGNNISYRNTMYAEPTDGRHFARDYSFFVTLQADSTNMIVVDGKRFGPAYLQEAPPALRKYNKMFPRKQLIGKLSFPVALVGATPMLWLGPREYFRDNDPGIQRARVGLISGVLGIIYYKWINRGTHGVTISGMMEVVNTYNGYTEQ